MQTVPNHEPTTGNTKDPGPWRITCISPSRSLIEELGPALKKCFPGAVVRDVRHYLSETELAHEMEQASPDICFVDAITDQRSALDLIARLVQMDATINIVALLAANEPELILKCLRLGTKEFLVEPFRVEELQAIQPKLIRAGSRGGKPDKLGKVVCVMPVKGACGASTVACNLAFQWKRLGYKRILLADMDTLAGIQSFLLKVKSNYNLMDVLQHAETLDADLWKAMVTPHNGVDILLAPETLMQGVGEVRDASPVVDFARKSYEMVVLDAGSAYGDWNLSMARGADEVLMITTNELPALHGAQRALAYLEANDVPSWKLRLIINRYDKQVGLSTEAVASALHMEVVHTLPSDYDTVQKALIDGKPIPSKSPLGKTFSTLADKLAGRQKEPAPRSAPFGAFLSLFSRSS